MSRGLFGIFFPFKKKFFSLKREINEDFLDLKQHFLAILSQKGTAWKGSGRQSDLRQEEEYNNIISTDVNL